MQLLTICNLQVHTASTRARVRKFLTHILFSGSSDAVRFSFKTDNDKRRAHEAMVVARRRFNSGG